LSAKKKHAYARRESMPPNTQPEKGIVAMQSKIGQMVFGVILITGISAMAEDQYSTPRWPAMLPAVYAGDTMMVDRITINARSANIKANFDGLLFGPHLNMVDPPFSSMLVLAEAVLHPESAMSKGFVEYLRKSGCNAVRNYPDGFWWNPLGGEATLRILAATGDKNALWDTENKIKTWGQTWPTGFQVIDFFAQRGFDQCLVITPAYLDPVTKKVYKTVQVCNDVDGVLNKAAEANAGVFARYFAEKGYKTRLILELGNEAVGYDGNQPSDAEYAKLCRAFMTAIKKANPKVEVAVVGGRGTAKGIDTTYMAAAGGMGNRNFLKLLGKDMAGKFDHFILHIYDGDHWQDSSNAKASYIPRMIANWSEDLNSAGFPKTKILITEYRFNLWNRYWQTAGSALAEGVRMMLQVSNPRVAGIFIHNAPGNALFNYSNGRTWSLTKPPGEGDLPVKTLNGHIVDSLPELGSRYRMLPTGYVQDLLARTCRGNLVDEFSLGDYGTVSYLLTRKDGTIRLLVANLQPVPVEVKTPGFVPVLAQAFQGNTLDSEPADTLEQPYGIKKIPLNGTVPSNSFTLIELAENKGAKK
jgi:hypothetical protein